MKKILFALMGIMLSVSGYAADCEWATDTPADDSKYKYFVARVFSEESVSDAQAKAEQEINGQICRLFGAETVTTNEYYSDETSASGTSRTSQRCVGVQLKSFTKDKSGNQKIDGEYVACVKYKYSKSAYEAELLRIKNSGKISTKNINFNEIAGDMECRGAPVEIVTKPAGAFVTLNDGQYQGNTPIKFGNVCNGKYSLEITHPDYENVKEKLIVPVSGPVIKTLKRATKDIIIRTNIGDAVIFIDGVKKGKEPVHFSASLGQEYVIEAQESQAESTTRKVKFSKDSDNLYPFYLEKKSASLDFSAFEKRNPGVKIYIDGVEISSSIVNGLYADKKYQLRFIKPGFIDKTDTVMLNGGDVKRYNSGELSWEPAPDDWVEHSKEQLEEERAYEEKERSRIEGLDKIDENGNTELCRSILKKDYERYIELVEEGANTHHSCVKKIDARFYDDFIYNVDKERVNDKGWGWGKWSLAIGLTGAGIAAGVAGMGGSGGGGNHSGNNYYHDCGENAYYNGLECVCNIYGEDVYFIPGRGCIRMNCGLNAVYNGESCVCKDGYENYSEEIGCSLITLDCGSHAFQRETSCVCDDGYENWTEGNGCSAVPIECGSHAHQEETRCVCDSGYQDIEYDGYNCYSEILCSENSHQFGPGCVCDSGFGRDGNGICVEKSSDLSGSTIYNTNYADVYGVRDDAYNGNILIFNYGDGNVTGLTGEDGVNHADSTYPNTSIYIYNVGNGNIVGFSGEHSNNNSYAENTSTNAEINIINNGNGDVYGYLGKDGYNANAYATSTYYYDDYPNYDYIYIAGTAESNSNIQINNTGDGNVYGIYFSSDNNDDDSDYYYRNYGYYYRYASNYSGLNSNAYASAYDSYSTGTLSTATASVNINNNGSSNVYGIYGENADISNAYAKNSYYSYGSGVISATANGNINISNTGDGNAYGMYVHNGFAFNSYSYYDNNSSFGSIYIENNGNGNAYGMYGSYGNIYSNIGLYNAYTGSNGESIGKITILNSGTGGVYGMAVDAYNANSVYLKNEESAEIDLYNLSSGWVIGQYANSQKTDSTNYNSVSASNNGTIRLTNISENATLIGVSADASSASNYGDIILASESFWNTKGTPDTSDDEYYPIENGADGFGIGIGMLAMPRRYYDASEKKYFNASASVYNNGNIYIDNMKQGYGIIGYEGSFLSTAENGSININNTKSSVGILARSELICTDNVCQTTSVNNSGDININDATDAIGIKLIGVGEQETTSQSYWTAGNVDNSGDITITGAENAIGIYSEKGVSNSGDITITGAENAIGIYIASKNDNIYYSLNNSGNITIEASNLSNSYGIYVERQTTDNSSYYYNNYNITNTGTISLNGNVCDSEACSGSGSVGHFIALNGATLINDGVFESTDTLDFTDMGGIVRAAAGAKFIARDKIIGDLHLDSNIVSFGNQQTYISENMIDAGDTNELNLISDSVMFDASLSGKDVVMTMKDFDTLTDNKSLAVFLKNNYINGNGTDLFATLKSMDNMSVFNGTLSGLTGLNTFTQFAHEDLSAMREISFSMNNKLFENSGRDSFDISDSMGHFSFSDRHNGGSGQYGITSDRVSENWKLGYGMAMANINTNDGNGMNRQNKMWMFYMPATYTNDDIELVIAPKAGFAHSEYNRRGYNNVNYEGYIEKRIFGFMNDLRYTLTFGNWTFAPDLAFNAIVYDQSGHEDEQEFSLIIPDDRTISVETGLGFYTKYEKQLSDGSKFKLNSGLMLYREFGDTYNIKLGMRGMDGTFSLYNNDYEYRGAASLGFDYTTGYLHLYGNAQYFMDNDNYMNFKGGVSYRF